MPRILIGVPELRLCGVCVVTVTTVDGVAPSPEMIPEIVIGSDANAPTISHSGRFLANPSASFGYFSSISLSDALLKAFATLA